MVEVMKMMSAFHAHDETDLYRQPLAVPLMQQRSLHFLYQTLSTSSIDDVDKMKKVVL